MRYFVFLLLSVFLFSPMVSELKITEVDFLKAIGAEYNGLGPLMVKADEWRNRVILINTNSSSVSILDGENNNVINIPVKGRVPQYLKEESFIINRKDGNIYLTGSKSISIVDPQRKISSTFFTGAQYEMVAVDELSGNCFLTGRESKKIAFVNIKSGKIKYIKLFDISEKMSNLNQTPPPPKRKIVADTVLKKVFIFDGYTSFLFTLDMKTGKVLKKRKIKIKEAERFHFAGYNDETHNLYLVSETKKRKVIQGLKIDCLKENDKFIDLPGLSEGVGISYNSKSDQVYIPYDNHPVVQIVSFSGNTGVEDVKIPSYGNDASSIDKKKNLLYVASWAYGEIYVIDLAKKILINRIKNLGILPHMFSMAFNRFNNKLYIPVGATAVNGSFGSAITALNTDTREKEKINTGWGPIGLIELKKDGSFLVFNSEDQFAKVTPDGKFSVHKLPYSFPVDSAYSKSGNIYLSYGPHQSYWPTVYIWGARNGILEIEKKNLQIFDRRIPRLAQKIVTDKRGGLYGLQNSWGKENLFLTYFPAGIRMFAPQERIYFYKKIERENIQRVLKYDEKKDILYIVKTGESDSDPGELLIINCSDNRLVRSVKAGITPTDLVFDEKFIYICNFDSDTITKIDKKDYSRKAEKTGRKPLKMAVSGRSLYILNHLDNTLQELGGKKGTYKIPFKGNPDNIKAKGDKLYISLHNSEKMFLISFDTKTHKFKKLVEHKYPYGETTFDTSNSAFYLRGQFGDSIYELTKIKFGKENRIWVTDYLAGKLFIIEL
ncbi:MAG: hypothetical protein ABFR75_08005 [Acidobacteriota bacterium]